MNILEIEDIIKGLPDQSLVQEAQSPSGQMPQFLVVSEIQRRADMRKRFQNQQQETPQGTIAQQIVQGGIASMGNQQPIQPMPQQGMPPQGMPPMPPQGMPPAMQQQPPMSPPMSPPMMGQPPMQPQGMAAGGVVRMQPGGQLPYTGGTGGSDLRTGASYIYRDSIFNPENIGTEAGDLLRKQQIESLLENFPSTPMSRQAQIAEQNIRDVYGESGFGAAAGQALREIPGYALSVAKPVVEAGGKAIGAGLTGIDLATREPARALEQLVTGEIKDTKPLFEPSFTPATDFSGFDPITGDFLEPYLNPQFDVSAVAAGGNAIETDAEKFGETTRDAPPETTAETIEAGLNTRSYEDLVEQDMMKRPQGPDYSAAASILDQLQAVDYSAFKPDYAGLITEQERRAQKIRDDASKDASAQALIQLGAGLAAGDISGGLSAAGQSVADIKRQARAEAREEEGLARKLQLAQDEASMQIGLKQAEAERSIQLQRAGMAKDEADARSKAEVGAYEFEKTFGLSEDKLLAEIMTELGRSERASLSASIEQWKSLSDAVTEEDVATRNALRSQINSMLGNLEQSRGQLRSQFNIDSAAIPRPQGSAGGFSLVGTRPGQ